MTRARSSRKEIEKMLREAERRGWTVQGGGRKHYIMLCPNPCRCRYTVSGSSSYRHEAIVNSTRMRRHTCWEGTPTS